MRSRAAGAFDSTFANNINPAKAGKFDPAFFVGFSAPPPQAGEQTETQRSNNKLAVEARAKRRQAISYARLRDKITRGECARGTALSTKQQDLLALYDDGTLLAEANRLTRISGNGRLRHSDGSFVDIGGSTGGYTRTMLYDWQAPDLTAFEPDDPGDLTAFEPGNPGDVTEFELID